jgi:hypothetical protein
VSDGAAHCRRKIDPRFAANEVEARRDSARNAVMTQHKAARIRGKTLTIRLQI